MISLSNAFDSDLMANLSPALRAARVKAQCPSEACVRAGNCVEGFRSPRNPSNPPHKVTGIRIPGGDGLRPAGLCLLELCMQNRALFPIVTSSTLSARQGKSRSH